jgi:hypothetical protein
MRRVAPGGFLHRRVSGFCSVFGLLQSSVRTEAQSQRAAENSCVHDWLNTAATPSIFVVNKFQKLD